MDVNKVMSKEGLKWRCREHPKFPGDIICLDGEGKNRVICFRCLQIYSIPPSNLISMGCVLAANEHDILETYPPLKDQELSDKLRSVCLQESLEEIEFFFKKLREDFEREVNASKQRAKEILIKKEKARQQVLESYIRIAEIEKLKQLIVSDKEGAENDLDGFIKDKWNKAEENRKAISEKMSQYETGQYFSSDEPNRIAQKMINSLKSINFFEQYVQQQYEIKILLNDPSRKEHRNKQASSSQCQQEVDLIKSTYDSCQEMEITKIDNSIYQIKQEAPSSWGQVFLDPILIPSRKYFIQIELDPVNSQNYFFFGLVKDEGKDNDYAFNQNMCYCDYANCNGITKNIKGNAMQSLNAGKHSFEIRIHLDEKLLRVCSLPDYSSIVELDNSNKIDPKINYRFFLAILSKDSIIRINNVSFVDKFDGKM